jgi:SAM-dependent methyltransferase
VAEVEEREGAIRGRRCLDVGCSNGALLLAAREAGASVVVGVDVSPTRLATARQLCEGTGIDLRLADIADGGLPDGIGPFDVVFCTDVLEHVRSVPRAMAGLKRALAPGPDAYAYVSLYNGRHPACVTSEPHYGVPGLVLLHPEDAREVWHAVREHLGSALDYEVFEWPAYGDLADMAAAAALRLIPREDRRSILRRRARFWRDYPGRLRTLEAEVRAALDRLPLSPRHRGLIQYSVDAYGRAFREAHDAFAAAEPGAPEDTVLDFYMTWYAQPLRFLLRHA